ncbi:MAG: FkbM family methyltransferase [Verrucomicrobiales bacterium]
MRITCVRFSRTLKSQDSELLLACVSKLCNQTVQQLYAALFMQDSLMPNSNPSFHTSCRRTFSRVTRSTPSFRGKGRIFLKANQFFLDHDADPTDQVKLKNGTSLIVDLRSLTEAPSYYTGEYDSLLIKHCLPWIKADSIILDVGANIGFYTITLASHLNQLGGTGKLLAFEPHPGNFQRLEENIAINQLNPVVSTHQIGLSDSCGKMELVLREDFKNGSETGNASISSNREFDEGFIKIPIQVNQLDSISDQLLPANSRIDFIKVDIEGHEDFFLRGAFQAISKDRPVILTEVNPGFLKARDISASELTINNLPNGYQAWELINKELFRINHLDSTGRMRNIFLIPDEKIPLANIR